MTGKKEKDVFLEDIRVDADYSSWLTGMDA
jgi:hypothetical protein